MNRTSWVAAGMGGALLLGGCSSGSSSSSTQPAASANASASATATAADPAALKVACGEKIVLQTDWFPEPEHGGLYQLVGPNGTVDAKRGRYSGPIADTGVTFEIRAGGPYAGNQQVSALMYQDPTITMGFVNTDEAVQQSGRLRTVAVFAPLANSPSALMWNPAKHNFKTLADIGSSKAKVLYFEGTAFVDYLVGRGLLTKAQLDPSYDGSPSRFVADGDDVQEVFATNEPYKYEHDIPQWKKPVAFKLISESGYQPYPENIAVKPEAVTAKAECLKLLVPRLQQAQVDYMRSPEPVNTAMLAYVQKLHSFWTLSPGLMSDAVAKMLALKLVANSPDGALGSFDLTRVQHMIDLLTPLYTKQRIKSVKTGVTPADIVTNSFIDPSVHL